MAYIKKNKPRNYLNNKDLMEQIRISRAQNQMTDELGKMCMALAEKYAMHPTFANIYSYKEDMVAFGIFSLVKGWKYFNPDKGSNPFAYLTQVTKHAFYHYLNSEKKSREVTNALALDLGVTNQESDADFYNDLAAAFGNEPEGETKTTSNDTTSDMEPEEN